MIFLIKAVKHGKFEKNYKTMNELVKNEGYMLDFEYSKDIYVFANEVRITQVFYNLLLKAITHCGDDEL